ncbi:MAG: MBL fold metallo-hydrolase [Planctomycetota bacterium]
MRSHAPSLGVAFAILLLCVCDGPAAADGHEGPHASAPTVTVLTKGYVTPIEGKAFVPGQEPDGARRVAGTVVLVQSPEATIVADPGMVADRALILEPLAAAGVAPEDVTHVFISHHHPDHTVNIALFPNAKVIDFHGIYHNDVWEDHPAEYQLTPHITVWHTPGHTDEDATLLIRTKDGIVAYTHLWWNQDQQPEVDPLAEDPKALIEQRRRVLAVATRIITGHGGAFDNEPHAAHDSKHGHDHTHKHVHSEGHPRVIAGPTRRRAPARPLR